MNGVPIARILGFEIRLHFSWVLIVALIAVYVADTAGRGSPALPAAIGWLVGGLVAAAFLLSVLAHELAHAVVARRRGVDGGPITLYFFGGSASLQLESDRPRDDAAIAVAGPLASLAIGGVLFVIGFGLAVAAGSQDGVLAGAAFVLAAISALNLILGGINLLPAYPLDGGRLVRALVWARTGDERVGAKAAATTGRTAGWLLIGIGLALLLGGRQTDGVMLGLAGWALSAASRAVGRRLVVQELLRDVRVSDVMEREVATVAPHLTVDTFADRILEEGAGSALPVLSNDEVVGLIGMGQLRRLGRRAWATTRAGDLMVSPPSLPLLGPDDSLWSALDRLRRSNLDGLPVVEGVRFLGVVSRRAILATIQSRAQLQGISLR